MCVIDDQEDDDEQVISWTEQEVQDHAWMAGGGGERNGERVLGQEGRRSDKGEKGVVFLDDDVVDDDEDMPLLDPQPSSDVDFGSEGDVFSDHENDVDADDPPPLLDSMPPKKVR